MAAGGSLLWGVGNQHLIGLLSLSSSAGMCAMDAAKFFFGVRLESRMTWRGEGVCVCMCVLLFEGVAVLYI